jgi:hypothetical protein
VAALVGAGIGIAIWRNPTVDAPSPPAPATFVGGKACAACHQAEAERWRGSHHAVGG